LIACEEKDGTVLTRRQVVVGCEEVGLGFWVANAPKGNQYACRQLGDKQSADRFTADTASKPKRPLPSLNNVAALLIYRNR